MADGHLAAQRGEDFLPIFANGELDDRGGGKNEDGEKEPGSNMSHSFIPYFVHRMHVLRIGSLARCFCYMFALCSSCQVPWQG